MREGVELTEGNENKAPSGVAGSCEVGAFAWHSRGQEFNSLQLHQIGN